MNGTERNLEKMIKCDESMKKSKEQGYIREGVHWYCNGDCENCHCALHKKPDGTWEHKTVGNHHGGKNDV